MDSSLEMIPSKAMTLPATCLAALAKKLLDCLKPGLRRQEECELAWAHVAGLRFEEIKNDVNPPLTTSPRDEVVDGKVAELDAAIGFA